MAKEAVPRRPGQYLGTRTLATVTYPMGTRVRQCLDRLARLARLARLVWSG